MVIRRREFIRNSGIAATGLFAVPTILSSAFPKGKAPSDRINVAVIGLGRQTVNPNIPQFLKSDNSAVVAVCDVDSWRLANAKKQVDDFYSAAKGSSYKGCGTFDDFREVMIR